MALNRIFKIFLLLLRLSPLTLFAPAATADFLYVASEAASTVGVYTINPTTGALTLVENELTGLGPTSVAVDPTGKFAYVTIGTNGTVSAHTINPTTGALTLVENELTGLAPRSVAIDPTGKFAYVANYSSNTIGVYAINPTTGALTLVENELTGLGPISVAIDPIGKFAYVANEAAGTVRVHTIDPTTGALTFVENESTGSGPTSVAVDSTGKFAYVTVGTNGTVEVKTIDPVLGMLTQVENELTGLNPRSVAIDPTGKFAYVANYSSNTIGVYAINPTTGALTQVENVSTALGPVSIASVLSAPGIPSSITVPTTSTGTHTISWGAATGTVTRYELQQDTNSSFTAPVTAYSGTALSSSVVVSQVGTYYYRVRACNGTACSAYATGANGVVVTTIPPPGVPSSITVPATSSTGSYSVSWGAATGTVTRYELYEATNSTFTGAVLTYSGVALSVTLTGKANGTYYYQVRACNGTACSAYQTGTNGVVVYAPPPPLPGAPSSITAPTFGVIGVPYTISWGAASGTVANYQLYESNDPAFSTLGRCTRMVPPTCYGTFSIYYGPGLTATGPSPTRGGLPSTLYYRVRACNASGCGPYSAVRSVVVR